jgi:hypothetical protein
MKSGFSCAACLVMALPLVVISHLNRATAANPELAKERLEDIVTFEERFFKVDRSFDVKERQQATDKIAALRNSAPTLSAAQFELALAEIVALAHNAHSAVQSGRWGARFNRLPVSFILFDDGLRVGNSEADPSLQGLSVEAIAGKSLDDLRQAWSRYQPGPSGWRDQHIFNFIESPELLHAAGIASSADRVEVAFKRADGSRLTRTLSVGDSGGGFGRNSREIEFAPPGVARPLYLQEPDAILRYVDLTDRDTVYIQFRRNFDPLDRDGFRKRADDLAIRLKSRRPRFVIVDQRFNGGGDLNNTRELMKAIPGCLKNDGRVFVITSGRTFSAAISSVGYLKQAGGPRVTIVGKPVGDELDFWAEGRAVMLPHSGTAVSFSTERHNYQTGCPEPECHPPIQRHPIAVKTLAPDVSPAYTWADFAAGRDPYLDAVFELMRK